VRCLREKRPGHARPAPTEFFCFQTHHRFKWFSSHLLVGPLAGLGKPDQDCLLREERVEPSAEDVVRTVITAPMTSLMVSIDILLVCRLTRRISGVTDSFSRSPCNHRIGASAEGRQRISTSETSPEVLTYRWL